jgi:OOP family OmpA-OmpF porin
MQKTITLFMTLLLSLCSQAFAIDFPEGGSPNFFQSSTAYSSQYFDKILKAHNLQLENAAGVPASYAKEADGAAVFNHVPTAYTPNQYHSIFTAYGLELTTANAQSKLLVGSYAKVVGDQVVFGNDSIAYGGPEWENIIGAYSLPAQAAVVTEAAAATPGDDDGDGVANDKDACPDTPKYAAVDERGCWVLSSALLFDFDKAVIKKEFYPLLDNTKKVFDSHPLMRVAVEGHADSTGSDDYNKILSQKRAQAVVDYLVENVGIAQDRLEAIGYGELKPAYSNDTKEGQSKNRRVEFSPVK